MNRDNKLQKLRKELGYTQEKFAKVLNIQRAQLAMLETGARIPNTMFLLELKETFNLSYEWIGEWACETAKQKRNADTVCKGRN